MTGEQIYELGVVILWVVAIAFIAYLAIKR